MSISLTRDEFLKRLAERDEQFKLAIMNCLKQVNAPVNIRYETPNNIAIELSELVGTIARDVLIQAIDTVYHDQ